MKDDNLELLAAALQHDMTLPFAPERPERRPRIIRLAANGYTEAHLALMVYADRLHEAGEPLPDDLHDYVFRMALMGFKTEKKMRNVRRDMAICDAISALYQSFKKAGEAWETMHPDNDALDVALRLDRAPATKEDSAISLVRKALARNNIHLTEETVKQVWQRKRDTFAM